MPLNPGNIECTSGLAKEIHDFMVKGKESEGMGATDTVEMPVLDSSGTPTGEITKEDTLLKRLCYNLSKIILDHIKDNLEIVGVEVEINDVKTEVSGECTVDCNGIAGGTCKGSIDEDTGIGEGHATGQQSNNGLRLIR